MQNKYSEIRTYDENRSKLRRELIREERENRRRDVNDGMMLFTQTLLMLFESLMSLI